MSKATLAALTDAVNAHLKDVYPAEDLFVTDWFLAAGMFHANAGDRFIDCFGSESAFGALGVAQVGVTRLTNLLAQEVDE